MEGFGNCCFFLSLLEGLSRIGLYDKWTLDELISLSKFWTPTKKGQMVDTSIDSDSIQMLAIKLDIRIVIYSELEDGEVNIDSPMVYGLNTKKIVRIVKVLHSPHYNFMTFRYDWDIIQKNESLAYMTRLEIKREEYINKEKEALVKQAEENKKIIDKEMEDHYREIEALKIEKEITNVVVEVSNLQQELNGWLESLTTLGRNLDVEKRIANLFYSYKSHHDTLETLQSELSKL